MRVEMWQPMDTAPKDCEIIVRRHNGCFKEHYVVWWTGEFDYPWHSYCNSYVEDRFDEWHEIPTDPPISAPMPQPEKDAEG